MTTRKMTPEDKEVLVANGVAVVFLFFFSYGIALFQGDLVSYNLFETGLVLGFAMILFLFLAKLILRDSLSQSRERP